MDMMTKFPSTPAIMPAACQETYRVQASGLAKQYTVGNDVVHALNDVRIDIRSGEMVVLLGPSGCGKTTLLRSIAGLEQPQQGNVQIEGKTVYSAQEKIWVPPEHRNLSMVFQSYALWPHMTVAQNIAYPLECRGKDAQSIKKRVGDVIDAVGLTGKADRRPSQLSGGQQQRVALARAIVADNHVVLFDEPLSNVDAKVRDQIRREIVNLQQHLGFAGLYVTHDQIEAGAIADRLVIMDSGRVAQIGTPIEVYDGPKTRYVANFMGPSNESEGRTLSHVTNGLVTLETSWGEVVGKVVAGSPQPSETVDVLFRPEACLLSISPLSGPNVWKCAIQRRIFMGSYVELVLEVNVQGRPAVFSASVAKNDGFGDGSVWVQVPPSAMWTFAR